MGNTGSSSSEGNESGDGGEERKRGSRSRSERRPRSKGRAEAKELGLGLGGRRRAHRTRSGPKPAQRLPDLTRNSCTLKLRQVIRLRDHLAMEREFLHKKRAAASDSRQGDSEEDYLRLLVEAFRGRSRPMGVFRVEEFVGDDHAIIVAENGAGSEHLCRIHSAVDKDLLAPKCSVVTPCKTPPIPDLFIMGVMPEEEMESRANCLVVTKVPTETYNDIGGLDEQISELRESVELPLLKPQLFEQMGIEPPKGVILYGPPGTGKTMLAKAVANKTEATFLRLVGSELIQRHAGDGPKLVREVFRLADAKAPSIIFLDEIDAVGTKRYETSSGGEREVQRTLLELLNQLDGFAARKEVKVMMATNRIDTLDPALIRPGRIDRKIAIPLPAPEQLERIFGLLISAMRVEKGVVWSALPELHKRPISGADLKALCTEAGLRALRHRRSAVSLSDFKDAADSILLKTALGPTSLYT